MVQNTKALSYHSIILLLCFPITFTLHNIPIVYKIFSITELHLLIEFDIKFIWYKTKLLNGIQEFTKLLQ